MGRTFFLKSALTCLFLPLVLCAAAQNSWDAYIARYDAGLGSVLLNMDMGHLQRPDLPFLVITGVNCKDCTGDGFPVHREFKRLYRLSDRVNRYLVTSMASSVKKKMDADGREGVDQFTPAMLVGTFTHLCQRLDYIYVADTVGIRQLLEKAYGKYGKGYTHHTQIQNDPEWDGYQNFLYPNESVRIYMMNHRAITRMKDAGDILSRPRFVEHLIYFDTIEDRELFIRYIGRMKYDIKDERDMRRDTLRYQVRLARFGTVSLEEMNNQTTYLSTKARDFNGVYKGWDTRMIGAKQKFHLLHNPIAEPINTAK